MAMQIYQSSICTNRLEVKLDNSICYAPNVFHTGSFWGCKHNLYFFITIINNQHIIYWHMDIISYINLHNTCHKFFQDPSYDLSVCELMITCGNASSKCHTQEVTFAFSLELPSVQKPCIYVPCMCARTAFFHTN
jgi:hypothetical protein